MALLLIAICATAFSWSLVRLVHAVRTDGYGMRPPPRSHRDWWDGIGAGLGPDDRLRP